jgi:two-component system nitrogen regulation response regulator NtrX
MLVAYDWPGNVRELRNTVERLVIMTPGPAVEAGDVDLTLGRAADGVPAAAEGWGTFQEYKDRMEAAYIRRQLELHGWNISKTAEALDIQRRENAHVPLHQQPIVWAAVDRYG